MRTATTLAAVAAPRQQPMCAGPSLNAPAIAGRPKRPTRARSLGSASWNANPLQTRNSIHGIQDAQDAHHGGRHRCRLRRIRRRRTAALIDTDTLTLNTTGYDFGSAGWGDGVPTDDGELEFHHENGAIRPHLKGSLHLDDARNTCGRMRLQYYDEAGDWLETKYGGEVCADDSDHHSWSVDLDPYADGSIASVRVSVQKEIDSVWYTPHSETYYVSTHADEVKITGNDVDLGDHDWIAGLNEPMSAATMSWVLDDDYLPLLDGDVLPALNGYFHVDNLGGRCARVNLRYLTEGGTFLYETHAVEHCREDNAHEAVWFSAYPWNSEKIGKVRVQLQIEDGGSWDTEAAKTVSIEE